MTSEYAQYRQWQSVSEALVKLAHHRIDPVIVTERARFEDDPDLDVRPTTDTDTEEEMTRATTGMSVALLICDKSYAFTFESVAIHNPSDLRITMRVAWADDDTTILEPQLLKARLYAAPAEIAGEILEHIE